MANITVIDVNIASKEGSYNYCIPYIASYLASCSASMVFVARKFKPAGVCASCMLTSLDCFSGCACVCGCTPATTLLVSLISLHACLDGRISSSATGDVEATSVVRCTAVDGYPDVFLRITIHNNNHIAPKSFREVCYLSSAMWLGLLRASSIRPLHEFNKMIGISTADVFTVCRVAFMVLLFYTPQLSGKYIHILNA